MNVREVLVECNGSRRVVKFSPKQDLSDVKELRNEIEKWIACDKCTTWYHWECVNVVIEPDSFVCSYCE